MASYFPKALWFKEWKEQRGKAFIALAMFSLIPVGSVLALWLQGMAPHNGNAMIVAFWKQFNHNLTTYNDGAVDDVIGIVTVIVMAVTLVTAERTRGSLWYTLSTPIRRDDWLLAKFLFGLSVLIGSFTLLLLWQAGVAAYDPVHVSMNDLLLWYVTHLVVDGSIYAVAFIAGVCVTSVIGAFVATIGLLGFPSWLQLVLTSATTARYYYPQPNSYVAKVGSVLNSLSPLGIHGTESWGNPFLYWYLLLVPLGYWLSLVLFVRIKAEFLESLLTFPRLWYGVFGAISVLIGSYVAALIVGGADFPNPSAQTPTVFILSFVMASAVIWIILSGVLTLRKRRRLQRHSNSRRREA